MIHMLRLIDVHQRLPARALFSGRTAAWLHGLDMQPCEPIEVTLPRLSRTSHLAGISLKRSDVLESDVALVKDLPATSCTRTIADLGRHLPLVEAVVVLDMALHRRLVTFDDVRQWIGNHPRYRGIGRLGRALVLAEPEAESPMETRLRLLLVLNGLPRPMVQVPIHDSAGHFLGRPDLFYPRPLSPRVRRGQPPHDTSR